MQQVSCNTCYQRRIHNIRGQEPGCFFPPLAHCHRQEQTGSSRAGSRPMDWGRCCRGSLRLMQAKQPVHPQLRAKPRSNHRRQLRSILSLAQRCCCSLPTQSISCYHPTEYRENSSCTHCPSQHAPGEVLCGQLHRDGFHHQRHHNILFC